MYRASTAPNASATRSGFAVRGIPSASPISGLCAPCPLSVGFRTAGIEAHQACREAPLAGPAKHASQAYGLRSLCGRARGHRQEVPGGSNGWPRIPRAPGIRRHGASSRCSTRGVSAWLSAAAGGPRAPRAFTVGGRRSRWTSIGHRSVTATSTCRRVGPLLLPLCSAGSRRGQRLRRLRGRGQSWRRGRSSCRGT